ncbi:hypothetical protein [Parashewanella tropica]|uniref:hypothetical protein n=1 Tax=Parashewanella tropica TaxID=2547970 RepID=UPI00105981D4|nr:hypothetical protein [Parashewanella tropica]
MAVAKQFQFSDTAASLLQAAYEAPVTTGETMPTSFFTLQSNGVEYMIDCEQSNQHFIAIQLSGKKRSFLEKKADSDYLVGLKVELGRLHIQDLIRKYRIMIFDKTRPSYQNRQEEVSQDTQTTPTAIKAPSARLKPVKIQSQERASKEQKIPEQNLDEFDVIDMTVESMLPPLPKVKLELSDSGSLSEDEPFYI